MHPKLKKYLKREAISLANKCINLDQVGCPDARRQIIKEGLACSNSAKPPADSRTKKRQKKKKDAITAFIDWLIS